MDVLWGFMYITKFYKIGDEINIIFYDGTQFDGKLKDIHINNNEIVVDDFVFKLKEISEISKIYKFKVGDTVKWFLNSSNYITGVVVEICEDNTYWVEHSNGQQRHYKETELTLYNS